jgi:hypothetical protein
MPVDMTWYDEKKTIALYTMTGHWTFKELHTVTGCFGQKNPDNEPQYFILDLRQAEGIPGGILAKQKDLMDYYGGDETINILVGAGRVAHLLLNTLQKAGLMTSTVSVTSLQAAEDWIAAHRGAADRG